MEISPKCYEFADHLFKNTTIAELSISHNCADAPANELEEWNLSNIEWTLARAAALEARRSGKSPRFFLEKAAEFFRGGITNTGKHFHLEAEVAARPR